MQSNKQGTHAETRGSRRGGGKWANRNWGSSTDCRFSQRDKIGGWCLKISAICVINGSEKGPLRLPCLVFFFSVALCLCVRNFNSCSARGKLINHGDTEITEGEEVLSFKNRSEAEKDCRRQPEG